ncbi:hypothetical protein BJ165DRAFT_1493873 [Panaeolus papilionaceus]|nr:hypothetical protein BJ165DRAFT_1493816 [Panaeolus papilionaceus]KAF9039763.1 hypothetical protein BJ165DRAFT_1493873 [Panaeolus papilionaceus]
MLTTRPAKCNSYRIDQYVYFLCYPLSSRSRTACSILAERPDVVVKQACKCIKQQQFKNKLPMVLFASLASGFKLTDDFITPIL